MYPNEVKEKDEDCCIICWDNKNVYKMQSFVLVTNTCSCDSLFHGSCLFNWVHQTHSCPICRKPIETDINEENVVTLNNRSQIFRFIHFTNNNAYKIFKYIFLFIILKTIYDILNDIQHTIEYNSDLDQEHCFKE